MAILDWYLNHPAGNIADWWDNNKKESEQTLHDFVDAHPHFWAVGAAVQTSMDVGSGFVDVLRFGRGMAAYHETGRLGPLIQDAFRGLTIASGGAKILGSSAIAGRLGPALGRAVGLYEDVAPGQGICAPIAVANAVRRTGQKLMLSLNDIALAHCRSEGILSFEGATIEESISALKRLKVQHEVIPQAKSWESLVNLLKERQGVVMARVIGTKGGDPHRIVVEAVRDGVRIVDRSGIYGTLEDLSKPYALNGGRWVIDASKPAVLVRAVTVRVIKGAPTLLAYVNALLPNLQGDYTTQNLDAKMQIFRVQRKGKATAAARKST